MTRADRRRRGRDRFRFLSRIIPFAGLLLLVVAGLGRLFGWPLAATLGALGALVVVTIAAVIVAGRRRDSPDTVASRVDADAGLGGELRSAHWFAMASPRDAWADFHLTRAATRAANVAWASLYPADRQPKAWAAAVICVAAALTIAYTGRFKPALLASTAAATSDATKGPAAIEDMSAELRAKLEAMLKAMGDGKAPEAAALADLETLKQLMAAVDPALQKKLDELLKQKPLGKDAQTKQKNLDAEDLNERADNADSAAGLPEDVRFALEDLAARLANANTNRQTNENNPGASSETGEKGRGSDQAETAMSQNAAMMREAASDPGAAKMMQGGGMMGGDSRPGAGGNADAKAGSATPTQIAEALRKELIEASVDTQGENVTKEDLRRKTEQGKSGIGYTRVAPTTNYDPSRATAPPVVPEARQPLLQRYFIRR